MKFAAFNATGLPIAFYDPMIHGDRLRDVYETPEPTKEHPDPVPVAVGQEQNPYCLIPDDAIAITDEQWQEFIANPGRRKWQDGAVAAYEPPAPQPTLADYSNALEAMLNVKAAERRYDSIRTAVTYRDDPNPQYAAEGQALFEWRSAVWTYATEQLALVQAGEREQPAVEAFIAEVRAACPFAWPGP